MPDSSKDSFTQAHEFIEPDSEFRDRLLHLCKLNSGEIIHAMANNNDELVFERLYGETGTIKNLILLRLDPADPKSYADIGIDIDQIKRAHALLKERRGIEFGCFDLPGKTLHEMDETSQAFYRHCHTYGAGVLKPQP